IQQAANYKETATDVKERVVTHSELRFVFRNWDKGEKLQDNVTFWYQVLDTEENKKAGRWSEKMFTDLKAKAASTKAGDKVTTTYLPGPAPWNTETWKKA